MRSVFCNCMFLLLFFVLFPALRTPVSAESGSVYFYDNNSITGFEASNHAETVNINHITGKPSANYGTISKHQTRGITFYPFSDRS